MKLSCPSVSRLRTSLLLQTPWQQKGAAELLGTKAQTWHEEVGELAAGTAGRPRAFSTHSQTKQQRKVVGCRAAEVEHEEQLVSWPAPAWKCQERQQRLLQSTGSQPVPEWLQLALVSAKWTSHVAKAANLPANLPDSRQKAVLQVHAACIDGVAHMQATG